MDRHSPDDFQDCGKRTTVPVSLKEPFALTADDLNAHFDFPIKEGIEAANALFKKRLSNVSTYGTN